MSKNHHEFDSLLAYINLYAKRLLNFVIYYLGSDEKNPLLSYWMAGVLYTIF